MSLTEKFNAIRAAYAQALPEWVEDYERTGNMFNDPYLLDWEMTPIERNVWGDIRDMCLPFYPQLPALNYFLDFGNPFLKIGIECDGKAWHDPERDRLRDARLAKAGWMIYRLQGHECVRQVDVHRDASENELLPAEIDKYYSATSEGVLRAIKARYFGGNVLDDPLMRNTLGLHRSTPETNPSPLPIRERRGPVCMGNLLDEYWCLLLKRAGRTA